MVRPCASKKNCKVVSPKNGDCGAVERGQQGCILSKGLFLALLSSASVTLPWLMIVILQSPLLPKSLLPQFSLSSFFQWYTCFSWDHTKRTFLCVEIFNTITYVKILSPNFKIKSLCPINSLSVLWWFLNSAAPRTRRPSESYLPCRSACLLISRLIAVSWSLFVIGWSSADC